MNSTSPVVTGGVTVTAATLVPLIQWALTGFKAPMPPDVPYLIAAGIVTGVHAAYNWIGTRGGEMQASQPQTQAQQGIETAAGAGK